MLLLLLRLKLFFVFYLVFQACYKRKDANQRNKNNFNYVETELYKTQKDLNELRDVSLIF